MNVETINPVVVDNETISNESKRDKMIVPALAFGIVGLLMILTVFYAKENADKF